ncbi:sensor domain-containing diguanylate cyclase [Marinobacter zhejiangensis]|uniref:diguanylate cyclase n=1 Tax=Marinobacter zhejiangensis TaxID=488535 RepID=A0A1I4RG06_9GAMM|nr:diguanylate cyclase [Marinobacter zhejiangensis]SFM51194.1 diguanylate cyclase (GGDEF) domain-containing protein [Marinobacter zhejiangensis]
MVRYCLLLTALLLWTAGAYAEPSGVAQLCRKVDASVPAQRASLLDFTCYLPVPESAPYWNAQTIHELPDALTWRPAAGHELAFTQSEDYYWVRINIHNGGASPGFWYLKLDYAPLDHVEFHLDTPSEHRTIQTGDRKPFLSREIDYRYYLLPISLREGETAEVSIRLHSGGALNLPLALVTPDELVSSSNQLTLTHGLFYGALLIFAIFNLLLFVSSGTTYYFYNAFYMAGLGMFLFAMGGFAYQYLWPSNPQLANTAIPISMALCALSMNLFGRSFLELFNRKTFTSRLLTAQSVAGVTLLVLSPYLSYTIAIKTIAIVTLTVICNLFFIGIMRWRAGLTHAKWYVISWSTMVLGTISYALAAFGYLPDFLTHEIVMQAAIGSQVILLNYAMVQRWRELNLKLLEVEYSAKQKLERQVLERTAQLRKTMNQLEQANRQLEALSTRDELTGLFNRRYLDSRLQQLARESQRTGHPVALVLVDADHFKQINDRFGHGFGDSCLQSIAQVLERNTCRPRDVAARYGGEEFALILPDTDESGALRVSQAVLEDMRDTMIEAPDGSNHSLTLSAGIAILKPGEALSSTFERADQALYRAKAGGRDRAELAEPPIRSDATTKRTENAQ